MGREFANIYIESSAFLQGGKHAIKTSRAGSLKIHEAVTENGKLTSLELPKPLFYDEDLENETIGALIKIFKEFLKQNACKKEDLILVVGVGNEGMTADALGARSLKNLEITEHFYNDGVNSQGKGRLGCIAGNVQGVTGIKSYDVVKGVIDRVKPSLVIAVDTLASKSVSRLQRVIQISGAGITPGSGVNNAKTALNKENLGVPVLAVGVPLVIYAKNIISEYLGGENAPKGENLKRIEKELSSLVVTVKEIDIAVEGYARVIGRAINGAVH
ncbi:MAG: GPR endopeptidase [Firmicutes bacterium]|nr:GPR endopeptidase [Bacillota bacterium]